MNIDLNIQVGGTLVPGYSLYIRRPEDETFLHYAENTTDWLNIHGCRTMGKSSLYAQYRNHLEEKGIYYVSLDIAAETNYNAKNFSEWAQSFCEGIKFSWHLEKSVEFSYDFSNLSEDNSYIFFEFFFSYLLSLRTEKEKKIIFIFDEYDCLSKASFFKKLLYIFRRLQDLRSGNLKDLIIYFVGLRPISVFGFESSQDSNENIDGNTSQMAKELCMKDFPVDKNTFGTIETVLKKSRRVITKKILEYSGGQPIVTMEIINQMSFTDCNGRDLQGIISKLTRSPEESQSIQLFRQIDIAIRSLGTKAYSVIDTYRQLLRKDPSGTYGAGIDTLLLYGLIKDTDYGSKEIKGKLFELCFNEAWCKRMYNRAAERKHIQFTKADDKRICLINTGGTIGMIPKGGKVVPPENTAELKEYFQYLDAISENIFLSSIFSPIDSINVFPDNWVTIARFINDNIEKYDGFVVAHGTDTMAYTASAVAFALGPNLPIPVVFTGSQTTPDVPYGDAHVNLYRACEIAKHPIPEVLISFNNYAFRAVRAQKKDDRRFDGFESPTYPAIVEVTGDINIRRELIRKRPEVQGPINFRGEFERKIVMVPQFPGLEPEFFDRLLDGIDFVPRGIIIQTLGAGNVTNQEPFSFIPLVKKAVENGIFVVITSQYPPDPGAHTQYMPAQAPIDAGAIHAGNMTVAAAVTKFRWVLAQVQHEADWESLSMQQKRRRIEQHMVETSLVGEF